MNNASALGRAAWKGCGARGGAYCSAARSQVAGAGAGSLRRSARARAGGGRRSLERAQDRWGAARAGSVEQVCPPPPRVDALSVVTAAPCVRAVTRCVCSAAQKVHSPRCPALCAHRAGIAWGTAVAEMSPLSELRSRLLFSFVSGCLRPAQDTADPPCRSPPHRPSCPGVHPFRRFAGIALSRLPVRMDEC